MILMLKRFSIDDVPVKLLPAGTTMVDAVAFAQKAWLTIPRLAVAQDERIAQTDIGSELISLMLVEFDPDGWPLESKIVSEE